MIKQIKGQMQYDEYLSGNQVQIRRNLLLENAVDAFYSGEIDLRTNFRIQFIDA
jgi:hypothetical protein